MIVAEIKPIDEIFEPIHELDKILIIGCGGCTSICLAGGQKEVDSLANELRERIKTGGGTIEIDEFTIERQCNADFFIDLDAMLPDYQAVISMACGAGVQFVADRYPDKPIYPALNTSFVGVDRNVGWYEENCRTCGDCVLGETGGICPVTRCAKSLFNGPCGGTRADGSCEIDQEIPCAWFEIHERLKAQNRLELITKVRPAREWVNQSRRTIIQEAYKERYSK
ncbi:MAG: methylenetetrahydrofolate reductase C-terminal domain-containing protein [Deltaproteobacteria bacterium]|nr:methylenetetrahydrofolate reductase C-terminal domain-containing protein [Deltaproteobacteria bacterium]